MSHNATSAASSTLSPSQERALVALLAGQSVTEAAKAAKVTRQTVHRWMRSPDFLAALNAGRNDLRLELESKLENIASRAIGNVERSVREGDTRVSIALLKGLGLLGGRAPVVGTESAAEIRADHGVRSALAALATLGSPGS